MLHRVGPGQGQGGPMPRAHEKLRTKLRSKLSTQPLNQSVFNVKFYLI